MILVCIRWYAAYPLSYRDLEEIMEERGVLRVLEEERARREAANSPDKDLGSIMVAARRCDGAAYRRVENRDRGLWRWRHPGLQGRCDEASPQSKASRHAQPGDVFSFQLAVKMDLPLFFKGRDFLKTPVKNAMNILGYEMTEKNLGVPTLRNLTWGQ